MTSFWHLFIRTFRFGVLKMTISFSGLLRQWRCSSQQKSTYLYLDKGKVAENLKQSKDSLLVLLIWLNVLISDIGKVAENLKQSKDSLLVLLIWLNVLISDIGSTCIAAMVTKMAAKIG